jgi:hypothetical protein
LYNNYIASKQQEQKMTTTTQRDPKWDERMEVQAQHIRWREQFYGVKFNVLQKAYAHFRMFFVKKDTIIGANCTLANYVDQYKTVDGFREAIGDTPNTNTNKAYFHALTDAGKLAAWAIRVPFLLVALAFVIVREVADLGVIGVQKVTLMLPGSID